jgi:beta-lactamase regulating signal transducer with metallopeptidase domain
MLDLVIRGTLLLVLAFVGAIALRRASAAARHLLWASTLAGLLILPAVTRLGPAVPVTMPAAFVAPVAPHVDVPSALAPDRADIADPAPAIAEQAITVTRSRTRSHTHPRSRARALVRPAPVVAPNAPAMATVAPAVAIHVRQHGERVSLSSLALRARWLIWALGVMLVMARLLLGLGRVNAIVQAATPVTDAEWTALLTRIARRLGVYRRVGLRMGPAGAVPITCGILAPVVILPADSQGWDDERRALVLTHELAHVRRLDVLTHLIGQCAVALFWFHPLAWIASARMRLERERACDDLVLVDGARPSRYAGDLLDLVQTLQGASAPAVAALAMARRTEIEGRLLSILDAAVRRGPLGARRIAASLAAVGLGVVTIAAVHPRPADPSTTTSVVVNLPAVAVVPVAPVFAAPTAVPTAVPTAMLTATVGWNGRDIALADIANAAASLASDAAKRTVLFEIGERYGASDTLRHAYFAAINTIASSEERRRVLLALVGRGSLDEQTLIEVVRSAGRMASDASKAQVLRTVAGLDPLTDAALRHEFFAATQTVASSSERTRVLLAVLGEARARGRANGANNAMIARQAIAAATALPSTSDKVRVMRAIVRGGWLSDETVSHDFNICLSTLGSGLDYHYVVGK